MRPNFSESVSGVYFQKATGTRFHFSWAAWAAANVVARRAKEAVEKAGFDAAASIRGRKKIGASSATTRRAATERYATV